MSKYKVKVSVELVECDETENHEINQDADGSYSMVISEQDATSISADASKFIINDIRGAERHLKLFCRKIIIDTLQVF
ncbi:hypothetical protein [Desulfobacter curvatus]|uniref:hypothetical protein n=1 Tax=Desulfobacter curvatus TaxID=2290 RepID=UPI00037DF8EF|nr:hypothetical protein [Desulfobacter curvatus]